MRHVEYEITILAYYRDGTRSDPVSLRYVPCKWPILCSDGLGTGGAWRGPRSSLVHMPLTSYSQIHWQTGLWARPLDLSPQWAQVPGVAEVQIPQHE